MGRHRRVVGCISVWRVALIWTDGGHAPPPPTHPQILHMPIYQSIGPPSQPPRQKINAHLPAGLEVLERLGHLRRVLFRNSFCCWCMGVEVWGSLIWCAPSPYAHAHKHIQEIRIQPPSHKFNPTHPHPQHIRPNRPTHQQRVGRVRHQHVDVGGAELVERDVDGPRQVGGGGVQVLHGRVGEDDAGLLVGFWRCGVGVGFGWAC